MFFAPKKYFCTIFVKYSYIYCRKTGWVSICCSPHNSCTKVSRVSAFLTNTLTNFRARHSGSANKLFNWKLAKIIGYERISAPVQTDCIIRGQNRFNILIKILTPNFIIRNSYIFKDDNIRVTLLNHMTALFKSKWIFYTTENWGNT